MNRLRKRIFCAALAFMAAAGKGSMANAVQAKALAAISEEMASQLLEEKEQTYEEILGGIPEYSGQPYADVNDDVPFFRDEEMTTKGFERYGTLDVLGRCTAATACVGPETIPDDIRGDISSVKPTGWRQAKYEGIDPEGGDFLYNRCHLIGYQLTGENANEQNLITGTRYLNVEGMLPFENSVAEYVRGTGNHVMYRVTPVFKGNDLLCRGVLMEARSVEDPLVQFCVFCYNVQPGIILDYATGESRAEDAEEDAKSEKRDYVLNTKSKKFHYPSCDAVGKMKEKNRKDVTSTREDLLDAGYDPCGMCRP